MSSLWFIYEVTFFEYAFRMTHFICFVNAFIPSNIWPFWCLRCLLFSVIVCLITAFYRSHWISPNPLLRVLLGLFCHLFTFNLYTYFTMLITMSRLSHVCEYMYSCYTLNISRLYMTRWCTQHGNFNDNTSIGFALKNDTPCLALLDELWGVLRGFHMQKWPRFIERAWHIVFIPVG